MRKLFEGLTRRRLATFAVLGFAALFLSAQTAYTPDSRPGGGRAALQAQIGVPAGTILPYAGTTAPAGYLLAFGQSLSVSAYPNLFAAIGYTYGGSGVNFTMPDLRGRTPFGKDNMGGSAANRITSGVSGITGTTLGAAGGDQNMPAHGHQYNYNSGNASSSGGAAPYTAIGTSTLDGTQIMNTTTNASSGTTTTGTVVGNAGTGTGGNVPPALIINYIVKF